MLRYITVIILFFWMGNMLAQEQPEKLKVFIDCNHCDDEQIRQRITGVDYVYDKFESNLHLLITEQKTGSGGSEIKVNFIPHAIPGMNSFTLTRYTPSDATSDMERTMTLDAIRFGLMPFLFSTGQDQLAEIDMDHNTMAPIHMTNPWDYWIFEVSTSGEFEAEDSQQESQARFRLRADRTTEILRIESEAYISTEFKMAKDNDNEISNRNNQKEFNASAVYSISRHWSAGISGELSSESYTNIKFHRSLGPAIEYNFFPWNESDRRRFTVSYHLSAARQDYFEETIYDKMNETLARQALLAEIEFMQTWGDLNFELEARNYLHDFSRYGLGCNVELGIRIFKGFSIFFEASAEAIHDQLYLPKGSSSIEDILIERTKQATSFELQGEVGLKYTFGSLYNNVVNRRI